MKRILTLIVACVATAVAAALCSPAAPFATPTELGDVPPSATPTMPTTAPSCPTNPCYAVSRTTGYQAKVGTDRGPLDRARLRADRRLVDRPRRSPTSKQVTYFNANEGGASAGDRDARAGQEPQLHACGAEPVELLTPYFGETGAVRASTSHPRHEG